MQNKSNTTIYDGIGLKLQESPDNIVLTRSISGNRIDTIALILGFFSLPILACSVGLLIFEIKKNNLTIGTAFPIILLFILGGYLFSLFLTGINRRLMFAGFSLEKNQSAYKVTQRENFKLTEKIFGQYSQVSLNTNNKDVSITLTENENEHELFELKELNNEQIVRVENIIAKFKN